MVVNSSIRDLYRISAGVKWKVECSGRGGGKKRGRHAVSKFRSAVNIKTAVKGRNMQHQRGV